MNDDNARACIIVADIGERLDKIPVHSDIRDHEHMST